MDTERRRANLERAWDVVLETGVPWEVYWTLTLDELSALITVHNNRIKAKNKANKAAMARARRRR